MACLAESLCCVRSRCPASECWHKLKIKQRKELSGIITRAAPPPTALQLPSTEATKLYWAALKSLLYFASGVCSSLKVYKYLIRSEITFKKYCTTEPMSTSNAFKIVNLLHARQSKHFNSGINGRLPYVISYFYFMKIRTTKLKRTSIKALKVQKNFLPFIATEINS